MAPPGSYYENSTLIVDQFNNKLEKLVLKEKNDKQNAKEIDKWMSRALELGVDGLLKEYETVVDWIPDGTTTIAGDVNPEKNRYGQPCGDAKRVVINHPGAPSSYIHANFVATPSSPKRFICTQGPLPNTVIDFWYMMIQEEVETIVMLVDFIDNRGHNKCHLYFPLKNGEMMEINENISVTMIKPQEPMTAEAEWVKVSTLRLDYLDDGVKKSRLIRHFHWVGWPEGEVPKDTKAPLELFAQMNQTVKPIVMHCGGGTGRPGTFIAIQHLMESMNFGQKCPSMIELIKELRSQRLWSIIFDLQYLYVHRLILDHYFEGSDIKNQGNNRLLYEKFSAEYQRAVDEKAKIPVQCCGSRKTICC